MKRSKKWIIVALITLLVMIPATTFAAPDVVETLNKTQTIIFTIVRSIGVMVTVFGFVYFGIGWFSHDPTQRITGLMCIVGGLIIAGSELILKTIGVL